MSNHPWLRLSIVASFALCVWCAGSAGWSIARGSVPLAMVYAVLLVMNAWCLGGNLRTLRAERERELRHRPVRLVR